MATVPTIGGRSVRSSGIGAPQFSMRAPDAGAAVNAIADAESGLLNVIQAEKDKADTAAVMDAEQKLSEWKMRAMFDPQSGVYTRKGRNALDITNQTVPQFEQHVAEVSKGLRSEAQRERFQTIVASQRQSLMGELNRYEYGERQSYYDEVDKGQLEAAQQGASLYFNDPQQVAYYQNKANAVLGARAQRKGMPAELAEQERLKFNSSLHTAVLGRMMEKDPTSAAQYFAARSMEMTADDQERVSGALQPTLSRHYAGELFNAMRANQLGAPAYWQAQKTAESGGRQFDKDGNVLTSSAGAMGTSQMLISTGPEAAAMAGLPWDEERFRNDAAYNEKLGMAYSAAMFRRYSNDPVLSLAAYNAGMGNVDAAIKKAGDPRSTGDYEGFLQALPKPQETGPYVKQIIAQSVRPSGKKQTYAQMLEVAQQITDETTRKYFVGMAEDYQKAETAKEAARYEALSEQVGSVGLANIPPAALVGLPDDDLKKLEQQDRRLREGTEPVTDYRVMERLLSMPPAKLAELSLERDIRPHLSNTDFTVVRGAWESARKGDGSVQGMAKAEFDALQRHMNMEGILTGKSKDATEPANLAKQDAFKAAYQARKDAFRAENNGRDPSPVEAEELMGQLRIEARIKNTGWFGSGFAADKQKLWEVAPEQLADAYLDQGDFSLDAIPARDRHEIVNALRATGQSVTEANIVANYLNRLNSQGLKVR